jgi:formylglycine-generating enzyme required for sulfatase activity
MKLEAASPADELRTITPPAASFRGARPPGAASPSDRPLNRAVARRGAGWLPAWVLLGSIWFLTTPAAAPPTESSGPSLQLLKEPGMVAFQVANQRNAALITLYQSTNLATPLRDWKPVRSVPVAAGIASELHLLEEQTGASCFFVAAAAANAVPTNMVWIQPGSFLMGTSIYDLVRYDDELPQHEITIPYGFWLARFELTQEEYLQLVPYSPFAFPGNPKYPVESVTWQMAMSYCVALTDRERRAGRLPPGCVYRLPTEAEWEYACRAGSTTRYSFGDDAAYLAQYGWYMDNADGHPHPGGELLPNAWGLYDMHGNVFEWCVDEYAAYPDGQPPTQLVQHVDRGGSYYCPPKVVRSACRSHALAAPDDQSDLVGFRVALGPPVGAAGVTVAGRTARPRG